jgi:hypothetical protein
MVPSSRTEKHVNPNACCNNNGSCLPHRKTSIHSKLGAIDRPRVADIITMAFITEGRVAVVRIGGGLSVIAEDVKG